ncbi:hypothetical protein ACEZCY_14235 [Streptacidiphilus sp. N1-12]|uniref:Uncharacterized protein n=2 Tax=Streptacidiphilus alkalitolerans TaxID=3342712 RepID=A0ABV6V9M0_9ACTN
MTTPTPDQQVTDGQEVNDPTQDTAGNPDVDQMDPYAVTIPPPPEDDSEDATAADTTDDPPAPATAPADEPVDPVAAAQAVIAAYEQERVQACAQDIEAVLAKYGMRLEVLPAQITLAPVDKS